MKRSNLQERVLDILVDAGTGESREELARVSEAMVRAIQTLKDDEAKPVVKEEAQ